MAWVRAKRTYVSTCDCLEIREGRLTNVPMHMARLKSLVPGLVVIVLGFVLFILFYFSDPEKNKIKNLEVGWRRVRCFWTL